jgi:hypothetical protein
LSREILRSISLLFIDDVHSFVEHLFSIVVEPFDIDFLGFSHLFFQLKLTLHLVESSQLDFVSKLLSNSRHFLILLQFYLVEL